MMSASFEKEPINLAAFATEQHAGAINLRTIDERMSCGSSCYDDSSFASSQQSVESHVSARRRTSFFANCVDQDEEGCFFCPCLSDDVDDEEQYERRYNKLPQWRPFNPLLPYIQSCQSKLYQNPTFYRLSLRMQRRFPLARRRASDPFERPVISPIRVFFLRIHYKSVMLGVILTLIIVKVDNSVDVLNNGRRKGEWQQVNQQIIMEPLAYNDGSREHREGEILLEVQQQPESKKDLIALEGYFLPPDHSAELKLIQHQQQHKHEEDERLNYEEVAQKRALEERMKAEAEAKEHQQQQLNAELARQQQQHHHHPPQHQEQTVELDKIKNTWDIHEANDIAMLWHVRASGSSVIRHLFSCHRLVQASGFGQKNSQTTLDDQVGVIYPTEGSPFVNIDSTTIAGIKHAASMNFANAQVADVVVSPLIYETNELFTHTSKGRFFAVFTHPVERAVRLFYTMQEEQPALREWTIERYARSTFVENNILTRQLSNHLEGPLDESHYRTAVEIIRDKFLVGLATKIDKSMDRFERYFRWTYRIHPQNQETCRKRILSGESTVRNKMKKQKRMPKEGDSTWAWLQHHNNYDLRLYAYIEKLFEEQAVFVKGVKENFRNVDTTCCRCDSATFPAFDLEGDDDEISPDGDDNEETDTSTFEGGIRLLRRLPPTLISALFVPCTVDDFWLDT